MWVVVMLPSRWSGSTKSSQEYRSPLCSSATASPQISAMMHTAPGTLSHDARAESKVWT